MDNEDLGIQKKQNQNTPQPTIPSNKKIGQNLNSVSVASNMNDANSFQNRENMLRHSEKLWQLMNEYIGHDKTSIQK